MLVDFLYSHPLWLVGLCIILVCTGVGLAGLYLCHRFIHVELRRKDNDVVGLTYAMVAVVYAVLIAFIVVNVFESASKGDEIATAEANQLSNLTVDSAGLPPEIAQSVRKDLDEYIDIVVDKEWPSQQAGKLDDKAFEPGWTVLGHLSKELAAFAPATLGQNVDKGAMMRDMDELIKSRRSRIEAAGEHLPTVVWQILILGGLVTLGYTFLFGAENFKMHLAITALMSAMIALVFVLIVALDYPFRGEVSVGDDAFVNVRATAGKVLAPEKVTPEHSH